MCTKATTYLRGIALLSLLMGVPAHAQDVEFGTAVVCNTQAQTERFVALFDGDEAAALKAVNVGEDDQDACDMVTVAYIRGPAIETAISKDAAFNIVRIVIVGIMTDAGLQATLPAAMFFVQRVDERVA